MTFNDGAVLSLVGRVAEKLNISPAALAYVALYEYLANHTDDITTEEGNTIHENQIQQVSDADSPTIFTTNQISGTAGATI